MMMRDDSIMDYTKRYILAKSVTDGHTEVRVSWDFEGAEYARERLRLDGLAILRIYTEREYDALWHVDSEDLDSNGKAALEYGRNHVIGLLDRKGTIHDEAGKRCGRENGRLGVKAAIAIALFAAFAIGAFTGYGISSFGIW